MSQYSGDAADESGADSMRVPTVYTVYGERQYLFDDGAIEATQKLDNLRDSLYEVPDDRLAHEVRRLLTEHALVLGDSNIAPTRARLFDEAGGLSRDQIVDLLVEIVEASFRLMNSQPPQG